MAPVELNLSIAPCVSLSGLLHLLRALMVLVDYACQVEKRRFSRILALSDVLYRLRGNQILKTESNTVSER